jgi:hypothetical protein
VDPELEADHEPEYVRFKTPGSFKLILWEPVVFPIKGYMPTILSHNLFNFN